VEAQATWRVLLKNRQLVTKREDLRLQGSTGSKTGDYQSEKATKREFIVVAIMISRMIGTPVFSDRTEFSVITACHARPSTFSLTSVTDCCEPTAQSAIK
jgi:hypothetical protein